MYEEERKSMVSFQLERRGIKDERVLSAMLTIPRHEFLPENVRSMAYGDYAVPIGLNQTISQPYIVGLMLELLETSSDDKALEIGSGSGYVAALLSKLCRKVIGIEKIPGLAESAKKNIARLKAKNIVILQGDGSKGKMQYAPYDKILVSAATPSTPHKLLEQLKPGGILVAPIGTRMKQELTKIVKTPKGYKETTHGSCAFVPLTGEHGFNL